MEQERVLKNRRKRASKGKTIRVSDPVLFMLEKRRSNGRKLSWDAFFRRVFGMPDRRGNLAPLVEGWLEVNSGRFYLNKAEANGAAVFESARRKTKNIIKPIRMREVRW